MRRKITPYFLIGLFIMALTGEPALMDISAKGAVEHSETITLFLSGDVMTGRGIDQILPRPGDPVLYESYMKSAIGYVALAEEANGPIKRPVDYSYVWGDALREFEARRPDLRIINLETAVTKSGEPWLSRPVLYRMHPENVKVLEAAKIDFCSLANNHVLDWGYAGLSETIETLQKAGIKSAGAGRSLEEARAPAVMEVRGKGRVIVFSYGLASSGIPQDWAATIERPGVNILKNLSDETVGEIAERVKTVKRKGDVAVFSVHWGGNWGYGVSSGERAFARNLIDRAGIDLVHGHSSHHVKGIEVHGGKLILYGAGDFINDYEGISGHEEFRGDLGLMYFATIEPSSGKLLGLRMTPTQVRNFRVNRASSNDARWLTDILNREGRKFGTRVTLDEKGALTLEWD